MSDLVPSLLNLGDVLVAASEFEPAIAVTERAVALREGSVLQTASTWRRHSTTWATPCPPPAATTRPRKHWSGASA